MNTSFERRAVRAASLMAMCAVAGTAMAAPPGVRHVRADAGPGGDGLSWSTAYNDLQIALESAAGSGGAITELWVKEGTYFPSPPPSAEVLETFEITAGVGLYGGFDGTETVRDERDPALHITVLSGDLFPGTRSRAVVTASGNDAVIDGLTVRDGGTAVVVTGSATIRNCIMTANHRGLQIAGSAEAAHCIISENVGQRYSTMDGAGVSCEPGSNVSLTGCIITGNQAGSAVQFGTSGGAGGGISAVDCALHITACVIDSNSSGAGGYFASSCAGGRPDGGAVAGHGGGLYLESSAVLLERCTISGNVTASGTPAGHCFGGTEPGTNSGHGGGVYSIDSMVVAVNCVLAGNQTGMGGTGGVAYGAGARGGDSGNGGAVWAAGERVELVNCTLAGNAVGAPGPGGPGAMSVGSAGGVGVGAGVYGDAMARVDNCIMWNGGAGEIVGSVIATYSDVQGGYAGPGNISADPMFRDASSGDYRLALASPAIDAGNSLVDVDPSTPGTQSLPTTDRDGLARRVDVATTPDTGIGAPVVDMGAHEHQGCGADLSGDGLVDFSDYLEFLNLYDAGDLRVDFNEDGMIDFGDYLEFLNLYEVGC